MHPQHLPAAGGRRSDKRPSLSAELAADLALSGVLAVSLTLVARHMDPGLMGIAVLGGLLGGALCICCGVLGRRRRGFRDTALVTLIGMVCVTGYQAVQSWQNAPEGGSRIRVAAAIMTVLTVLSVGMLANLLQARKTSPEPAAGDPHPEEANPIL